MQAHNGAGSIGAHIPCWAQTIGETFDLYLDKMQISAGV